MAQFSPAFDYMMENEDSQREYAIVPDSCPSGCAGPCHAISGINSGAFPAQFEVIAALPQEQRGPAISDFYEAEFWDPLQIGGLTSQDLANRVLDEGVNNGGGTAIRILQQAVNAIGGALTVDGVIGPLTLAAANAADPEQLLDAYRQQRLALYIKEAAKNPADAEYLPEWEKRALA